MDALPKDAKVERLTSEQQEHKENYELLRASIMHSYKSLRPFRQFYARMVQEYHGHNWGEGGNRVNYINKLFQAVDAYMVLLAANRPRVLITTEKPYLKAFARNYEVAINNLIKEIRLEETIRKWVLDAFLLVGVIKTHMADSGTVITEGDVNMDPGLAFASNVGFSDWVHDENANTITRARFAGDMYTIARADLEKAADEGVYDKKAVHGMTSRRENDLSGERVDEFAKTPGQDGYSYAPVGDVADVWLPFEEWTDEDGKVRRGKIVTFPIVDRATFEIGTDPLAELGWKGPEQGPYVMLGFSDVPQNIMPASPASHFADLNRIVNNVYRRQVKREAMSRENPIYESSGADSMNRLMNAGRNVPVRVDSISSVGTYKYGGVDPAAQQFLHDTLNLLNIQDGNVNALLGLAAQTDTVGQEQLLHSAGSKRGNQMQYRVIEATARVVRNLGSLLWHDEFKTIYGTMEVTGTDVTVQSIWSPENRMGSFEDYNFDINIHSMKEQTPESRVQSINSLLTNVFIPLNQMLEQQGGYVDLAEVVSIYADLLDQPRLRDIVKFTSKSTGPEQSKKKPQQAPKAPETTRNYVRRSVSSGANPQSQWASLASRQQSSQQE